MNDYMGPSDEYDTQDSGRESSLHGPTEFRRPPPSTRTIFTDAVPQESPRPESYPRQFQNEAETQAQPGRRSEEDILLDEMDEKLQEYEKAERRVKDFAAEYYAVSKREIAEAKNEGRPRMLEQQVQDIIAQKRRNHLREMAYHKSELDAAMQRVDNFNLHRPSARPREAHYSVHTCSSNEEITSSEVAELLASMDQGYVNWWAKQVYPEDALGDPIGEDGQILGYDMEEGGTENNNWVDVRDGVSVRAEGNERHGVFPGT